MKRVATVTALTAVTAAISCGGSGGEAIPPVETIPPVLLAHEIQLPEPISSEPDGMGFAIANTVAFQNGRLSVLEGGNDRIVVFDDRYRVVARFGREGSGPGELRDPVGMATWRHEYAVTELNNGRVSVFDSAGGYLRSFAIPNGFSKIGYGPDGTIYVNAYDGRNYLLAADREGALRPFGERPWDLYPDGVLQGPAWRISGYIHFAVAPSGTVLVYDPVLAAIVAIAPDGQLGAMRRLPSSIAAGLKRNSELLAKDFGGDPSNAPAGITDLTLTGEGRLLLLFPNVGAIGLVVDPVEWTGQVIRWGPGLDPRYGGFGGVLRADTLYRLSSDALRLFRLIPE